MSAQKNQSQRDSANLSDDGGAAVPMVGAGSPSKGDQPCEAVGQDSQLLVWGDVDLDPEAYTLGLKAGA